MLKQPSYLPPWGGRSTRGTAERVRPMKRVLVEDKPRTIVFVRWEFNHLDGKPLSINLGLMEVDTKTSYIALALLALALLSEENPGLRVP